MTPFSRDELRIVLGTSGVYALRMIGLYMALPLMSTWASGLPGATPFLVGIALGAYGLTQAIFQVPFGILGDVRGRRVVIVLSLLVFALGSAIVAWAGSIFAVIAGRLVQGVGAMASTLIALIGDHTRDDVRTRGMALLGLVLGVAFAAGFLLGPLVSAKAGVPAVFGAACVLSLFAVLIFEFVVPSRLVPHVVRGHRARPGTPGAWSWAEARSLFRDRSLLVLDGGIFVLHASVTGLFLVVPFVLRDRGIPDLELWKVYAPALGAGLISLLVSSRVADRRSRRRAVLVFGAIAMIIGLVGLAAFHRQIAPTIVFLAVFVAGFGAIEPLLAALLTLYTGRGARGTAAGVFNMVQFSGAFLGGAVSGLMLAFGRGAPLLLLAGTIAAWALSLRLLRDPATIVETLLEAPGLDEASWGAVHRALVSRPAVLEAAWTEGTPVRVRHWPDGVRHDELARLVAGTERSAAAR